MRKGKIKNSIVTIAMAMMLSVTAVVGFGTNAKAAAGNTGNKQYSPAELIPANFNSAKSLWEMICRLKED